MDRIRKATVLGYPVLEWDACTEFWVEKLEDFEKFTKSEEYIAATRKFFLLFSCLLVMVWSVKMFLANS
jgi:hypothetical protein